MPRYRDLADPVIIQGQKIRPGLVTFEFEYTGPEIYHKVQSGEQFRLDIISYKFYGTPDYAWIVAIHNKIRDMFSIEVGSLLRIPTDLDEVFKQFEQGQWA